MKWIYIKLLYAMKKYIYLCGPTVYNKVHIGNMRPIITFDLLVRALKFLYKDEIVFIHNITDIDDKIIGQAKKEKTTEDNISKKYLNFYLKMLKEFNIETIDIMPKVTDNIDVIENFILELKQNNFAYEINKSLYFDTNKIKTYGLLSNNKLDKLINGKENKEQNNFFDFVLWKNKTVGKTWKTKLGSGRPGWHTECAAFVYKYTNKESLLIHGGGIDLKFPHHENENAQYLGLINKLISKKWIHIGIINFKNQKMSKSLNNMIYADDFLKKYSQKTNGADLFRMLILASSYNATIELNDQLMESLIKKMEQIEKIVNHIIINEIKVSKNNELKKQLATDIIDLSFSNVYKILNFNIKKFNETGETIYALNIFNQLNFLGFNLVKKEINNELKETYKKWKELVKKKDFVSSDKLRVVLIKNRIL